VIGARVFAVEIHSQDYVDSKHDWRRADAARLRHEPHQLPPQVASKCAALVEALQRVEKTPSRPLQLLNQGLKTPFS
jgi:hypothetical protein